VEFIESRIFTRRLHQLAGDSSDEVLREIQADLLRNPDRGLYLYFQSEQKVGLLYLLDKDEQEDLNAAERKILRGLALEGKD
jgi:hypothetical protein